MDDSIEITYSNIISINLLIYLILDIKLSKMFIELGVVPYNGWTSPMVNLAQYNFKLLDK